MELNLDDAIDTEYNYVKQIFLRKVSEGYRNKEITEMKALGLSDDDIFIGEMLGLAKGLIEAGIYDREIQA